jgi:hypothetical protein
MSLSTPVDIGTEREFMQISQFIKISPEWHGCSKMQWPTTNQLFDHHDSARPTMHYYLISMIYMNTRALGPVAKVRSVK